MYRPLRPANAELTGPLATIGFGWERPEYYEDFFYGDPLAKGMAGARLEPFQRQGAQAEMLLDLTRNVFLAAPNGVQKIKEHYAAVRRVVNEGGDATETAEDST
jgi:hypothetical protein